jgi:hypothetical protein
MHSPTQSSADPEGRASRRRVLRRVGFLVALAVCALLAYLITGNNLGKREGNQAAAPRESADEITVLGLSNARFWAWFDTHGMILENEWQESIERERTTARLTGPLPPAYLLAVSGGGGDGALEANGRRYKEMNVDAGVVAQTFLYPTYLGNRMNFRSGPFARERHAYIIRNSRLDPDSPSGRLRQ